MDTKSLTRNYSPCDDRHSQESANTAENESDNAPSGEARWQWCYHLILAVEVVYVKCIASRVATDLYTTRAAHVVVVLWYYEVVLHIDWCFHHRSCKTADQMPVKMAMEEPDTFILMLAAAWHLNSDKQVLTWIVGNESYNKVAVGIHHEYVSPHWCLCILVILIRVVEAGAIGCTPDCLEIVSV